MLQSLPRWLWLKICSPPPPARFGPTTPREGRDELRMV